jgi:hypothetical protein
MLTRLLTAGGLAGTTLLTPLAADAAPPPDPVTPRPPDDGHCVLTAVERGGSSVVDDTTTRCYPTLAEALAAPAPRATIVVAVHYQGRGGSGTSQVIYGTSCATVWYPSSAWQSALSSTVVGGACTGAKHYTATNCSGGFQVTQGALPVDLNSVLNNNVGCVKYA